jgi:hypothetical protein
VQELCEQERAILGKLMRVASAILMLAQCDDRGMHCS